MVSDSMVWHYIKKLFCIVGIMISIVICRENGKIQILPAYAESNVESAEFDGISLEQVHLFYYNQLSDVEKYIYDQIKNIDQDTAILSLNITKLNGLSDNELEHSIQRAKSALVTDLPEYRLFTNRFFVEYDTKVEENGQYKFKFGKSPFFCKYNVDKLNAKIDQIVSSIKGDDQYSEIRRMCHYITEYTQYDYDYTLGGNAKSEWNDSAYGVILKGTGVCGGYADVCKMICDKLGIACIIVGNATHAWNFIEMEDGRWYSIDLSACGCGVENEFTLVGQKSQAYLENNNYSISDYYIMFPGENIFPKLSDTEYIYNGENRDFSFELCDMEFEEPDSQFLYEVNEDGSTCTITAHIGKESGDLTIPETIDGYQVSCIGEGALYGCLGYTGDIIIPDSVVEISDEAFLGCANIKGKLILSNNLRSIGKNAFLRCDNMTGELQLPETVETIGNSAFSYCSSLEGDLKIPDKVCNLDWFLGCNSMTGTLYLPDHAELEEDFVYKIFDKCSFSSINASAESQNYLSEDGVLYSKDGKMLLAYPGNRKGTLIVRNGCEVIASRACYYCKKISSVVLSETLKKIDDYAFYNAFEKDTAVEIPDSVTTLGEYSFAESSVNTVVLGKNIQDIYEKNVFSFSDVNTVVYHSDIVKIGVYKMDNYNGNWGLYFVNNIILDPDASIQWAGAQTEVYEKDKGVICGYEGSTAEKFAQDNDLQFLNCEQGICDWSTFRLHQYEPDQFEWSDDGKECSVECVCRNDASHHIEYEATVTADVTVPATCVNKGTTKYTAVYGDYSDIKEIQDIDIDPDAHAFRKWMTKKEANCTEKGSKTRKCALCGKQEIMEIEATGHDWNDVYTVDKAASCTEKGTESIHCKKWNCDATKDSRSISQKPHTYGEWKVEKEVGCTEAGSQTRKCTVCGKQETMEIEAAGHDWNDVYTVDKVASCAEEGTEFIHCKNCDAIKDSRSISQKPHTYGEWKVEKEAGCTEAGSQTRECTVCGKQENMEIEATGHDWNDVYTVDKAASCAEEGTESIHCKNCDAIKDSRSILQKPHTYGEWKVEKEAGCTEAGSQTRKCTVCGKQETMEIEAAGHDWDTNYIVDKEATYQEEGVKTIRCRKCNEIKESEVIPKLVMSSKKIQKITISKKARGIIIYKKNKIKRKGKQFNISARAVGKITYSVKKGKKYITVSLKGKVQISSKIPKGKYKIVINAEKTSEYREASRTVIIRVK